MANISQFQARQGAAVSVAREHVALDSGGKLLSGFIHRPKEPTVEPRPAVVVLHGLMGTKSSLHQLYVKLADELARAGMVALRIDFRGRGDSEGNSVDVTPEADIDDAARALDFLETRPDVDPQRLGLVGHSWGGTVAACLTGRDHRVAAVTTWGSVPSGPLTWSPPMRKINGRRVAELWGNLVGHEFYEGLRHIHALNDITRRSMPVLILYGTEDEEVPVASVEVARQALTRAGVPHNIVAIEGADHAFMQYEWEQEAIERTVDWLRHTLHTGS